MFQNLVATSIATATFALASNVAFAYSSVDTRILLGGNVAVMNSDTYAAQSVWESEQPGLQAGRAAGSVDGGVLKAYAGFSSQAASILDAYSSVRMMDDITISNEALTGQRGVVTLGFDLNWRLEGTVSYQLARPWASFYMTVDPWSGGPSVLKYESYDITPDRTDVYQQFSNGGSWEADPQLEFQFTFGTPFSLDVVLSAAVGLSYGIGNVVADAGHSAYWTGIADVQFEGARFTDFVVTSQSGTDWAKSYVPAIPEPATVAMMLAGLGLVVCAAKRKR